jgi:pimeloyl-ACP methyl ester carboxylesterase
VIGPTPAEGPTALLVHGAWGVPADWDDVVAALSARGVAVAVADLPTMRDPGATLLDDAAHVVELAAASPAPVVLCGHSYGGAVITQAAPSCPSVAHLVYLAAPVPGVGEAAGARFDGEQPDGPDHDRSSADGDRDDDDRDDDDRDDDDRHDDDRHDDDRDDDEVVQLPDGTTLLTTWAAPTWDYPPDALERMARHPRRPFAPGALTQPLTAAGWRDRPSTYVLAERDATVAPVRQREMAARCERLVELDSGHMVIHEHPQAVADLLADLAFALMDPSAERSAG